MSDLKLRKQRYSQQATIIQTALIQIAKINNQETVRVGLKSSATEFVASQYVNSMVYANLYKIG